MMYVWNFLEANSKKLDFYCQAQPGVVAGCGAAEVHVRGRWAQAPDVPQESSLETAVRACQTPPRSEVHLFDSRPTEYLALVK